MCLRVIALFAVATVGATGCDGAIFVPDGAGGAESEIAAAAPRLRRLTTAQYVATVQDLLGPDVAVPTELEVDTRLHGFSSIGASELTISPRAAEQYEAAALDLAGQMFGDPARRASFVGCEPTAVTDECVRAFFARFGRRAWRRPLTEAELDELVSLTAELETTFSDRDKALEFATAAVLQSPYFLFRVERGVPVSGRPGVLRYDDYEMATRLSYALWNTTPDDDLLDAAGRGELSTPEGVRAHAERLLASPRAQAAIGVFFYEYMNLDRLEGMTKDVDVFPQLTDTLGPAMRDEIQRLLASVALADRDYRDIFATRTIAVDDELAAFYGVAPPPEGEPWHLVELPDDSPRGGLLGTAGIAALYAHNQATSPTLRGKFVRQNLLCEDIPPPPPGVVTSLDDIDAATTREKLEQHRADPVCASCHEAMDPIGLAFENFDAIGAYRDTENGYPIDATGDLDGVAFDGTRELGELLATDPRVAECVARQVYRHATGHLEVEAELDAIVDLGADFQARGHRFLDLVVTIVTSDGFRFATVDATEAP